MRRAGSNPLRQEEQGRTPFEKGRTNEALGFGPPRHRHGSVLLDFTALPGQLVRNNVVKTSTLSGRKTHLKGIIGKLEIPQQLIGKSAGRRS